MAYVITEDCAPTSCVSCLEVCPVDAIHPKPGQPGFLAAGQLSINADTCIHCGSCARACPVKAVIAGEKAPPLWAYLQEPNSAAEQRF